LQTLFLHPYQRHVHSGQEQIGSISHEDDEDVGTQGLPSGNAEIATCELGVSKVAMGDCWGAQPLSNQLDYSDLLPFCQLRPQLGFGKDRATVGQCWRGQSQQQGADHGDRYQVPTDTFVPHC